ncbi:MAG: glycosyltransferase family 4 protein [Bacteroidales bacterium]|nr:glycosyltransferase family 4 protein [Bacteroidales bacterium]
MKVLMFGWEFPPHISGGLGTACYGLTKGLSTFPDIEILFVVPKAFGDEHQNSIGLIGANNVPVHVRNTRVAGFLKEFQQIEVGVNLLPYVDPEMYENFSNFVSSDENRFITSDLSGKFNFSGGYGKNLIAEISGYAIVAASIASNNTFDVIHAHDWLCYPAGIAAKHVSGKPLVIHVHATDFDRSGGNVNPVVFDIEQRGMEAADKIITVSNLTRNIVIEKYGIAPAKVVTVYNAVEPVETHDAEELQKFNEKIVTFLGRITMQKGPEYFIEAASLVLKRMDNVRFVMAGSGDMMHKMIRRAARLGITDKFSFTGFLKGDDVYKMFHLSDVYVMPSVSEPFGISPLEAMQSNVPVIISRQSGVAEVLSHAVKIDFWDTHAMADAIYGILNYSALHKIFQKQGKQEVDKMKWEVSAKHVRDVYYNLN